MEPDFDPQKLLLKAAKGRREGAKLEFKSTFDENSNECWCEVIKDIVAMANSGGGIIVFGVNDNGDASLFDSSSILAIDLADISNKVSKYTGRTLATFEIAEVDRSGRGHAAILIYPAAVPMIFCKPGTYDVGGGKQKTAFGQGTIYFRHSAKSEHGNPDDLEAWSARVRKGWMEGIRKVVEAPSTHRVTVSPLETAAFSGRPIEARITSDPSAQSFVPANTAAIWPFRQTDVLRELNERISPKRRITSHDMLCLTRFLKLPEGRKEFAYKPHPAASTQYSKGFVDWVEQQVQNDATFFDVLRARFKAGTLGISAEA